MTGDPKIAARLKAARIKAGYVNSGSDAARAFGWNIQTYLGHENGSRGVGRAAKTYARMFKVPLGWLLNGEGFPDDALPPGVSRGPSPTHKIARRNMPIKDVHNKVIAPEGVGEAESALLSGGGGLNGTAELAETRMVPELDVQAGAGAAAIDQTGLDGSVPVVAEWRIPVDVLRHLVSGPTPNLKIITIIGDSAEPIYPAYSRVMVNIDDRRPSPPGTFIVFDGLWILAKRVEYLPHSDPPTVQISSINLTYNEPYKRTLDEAHILGRVVGRWMLT